MQTVRRDHQPHGDTQKAIGKGRTVHAKPSGPIARMEASEGPAASGRAETSDVSNRKHTRKETTMQKPRHAAADLDELKALRKRCAMQRKELEQLKAIVTVASTSDVENVIIVKPSE